MEERATIAGIVANQATRLGSAGASPAEKEASPTNWAQKVGNRKEEEKP